jgi:hypothetical protein
MRKKNLNYFREKKKEEEKEALGAAEGSLEGKKLNMKKMRKKNLNYFREKKKEEEKEALGAAEGSLEEGLGGGPKPFKLFG